MADRLGANQQDPTRLGEPSRNKYFYGKLLDVSDFELEQSYGNSKRWLLNRLLNGSGVVCGLGVTLAGDNVRLLLEPGVALDGWGREILAPESGLPFDPRITTDDLGKPIGKVDGAGAVTVSLVYHECEAQTRPVLVADCRPEGSCAPAAVLERYKVVVKAGAAPASASACGFADLFKPAPSTTTVPNILPKLAERFSKPCFEPQGSQLVLLAQVNLPAAGPLTAAMIDVTVRPVVVSNALLLELIYCLAQRVQETV